jgi:hypothetical protein
MLLQIAAEMERYQLSVIRLEDSSVCLMTLRALGENDTVAPLTGLVYDNSEALEAFLSHAGNKAQPLFLLHHYHYQ